MIDWTESGLLEALSRGDEEAFMHLHDTHAAGLLRFAVSLSGSHAVAEEAVQEVFVSLIRRGDGLRTIRDLRSYLFTAVRNSTWRQHKRWTHQPLDEAMLEQPENEDTPNAAQSSRLEQALGKLPAEQRQVVLFKIDGGLTFEEIAEALALSPNTVASRYRYGMERLKQWIAS